MTDFAHDIVIGADPEAVRHLLAERGDAWWTTNAVIHAEPGGFCEFRFPAAGFHAAVRVKTNRPGLVEWWCVDSLHPRSNGFKNRRDWVGTTIRFELEAKGAGATLLKLRHLAEHSYVGSTRVAFLAGAAVLLLAAALCAVTLQPTPSGSPPGPAG